MADAQPPFAQWLDATMQQRGLSQAALAREVGVADAQVSRWRRGQVTPSVRYLQRLAGAFDVPRATLDQLAGYPVADGDQNDVVAGIDPQAEAAIQAYQARYRAIMTEQVPRRLWEAYAKACEALAEQLTAAFSEAVSAVEQAEHAGDTEPRRSVGFQTQGQQR